LPGKNLNQDSLQGWCPDCSPYLIAAAVMLPTFMEALDTAIASVALPHIAGSFSASTDEATWVLTSYLVAMPWCFPPADGSHCGLAAAIFFSSAVSFLPSLHSLAAQRPIWE
jgi:MFS family permease